MDEFDQTFNIVKNNERQMRLVSIFKDLNNLLDLLMFTNSDKVLWGDQLNKWEITLEC